MILLVGDSVPKYMWRAFTNAARPYGYAVTSAAVGSCPATGVLIVRENGTLFGGREACSSLVRQRQDDHVDHYHPALVLWWSRYEVADCVAGAFVCYDQRSPCDDRLPNGRPARPDGIHYKPPAKDPVARKILAEAMAVAGLAPSGPQAR